MVATFWLVTGDLVNKNKPEMVECGTSGPWDHEQQKRHIFNERVIEVVRRKRPDVFELFGEDPRFGHPICMQYNTRQKPHPSYGIALYNACTRRWLVVEPQVTIEMMQVVRGVYTPSMLPLLLDQAFDAELEELVAAGDSPEGFPELFQKYCGTTHRSGHPLRLATICWKRDCRLIAHVARRVLATRRSSGARISQTTFPKGRACEGECPFSAATREVEEETGIKVILEEPHRPRDLSRGGGPRPHDGVAMGPRSAWVPCKVDFGTDAEEAIAGNVCREFVSHLHSSLTGRIYRTTIWLCVIHEPTDPAPPPTSTFETRGGAWVDDDVLSTLSRVTELCHKCETTLNRLTPYLGMEDHV